MLDLNGKSILITGGTGSFGVKFIKLLMERYSRIENLVIFSRDEYKQYELSKGLNASNYPFLKFVIGDIRDKDRLIEVTEGIDIIIHAAALKQVPASEFNPMEFIKTNIQGTQNVIDAAIQNKVQKVIALSTDKAVAPVSLYGASKMCSDKLLTSVNSSRPHVPTLFAIVRYGNVMGSRGSVIPQFLKERDKGELSITHSEMTRFNASISDEFNLVLHALEFAKGGEVFIPKLSSYHILDLAKAISPSSKINIIGVRPGEKLHEEMIASSEVSSTYEFDKYYVSLPLTGVKWDITKWMTDLKGTKVKENFSYSSNIDQNRLSVDELRKLMIKEVDSSFQPI